MAKRTRYKFSIEGKPLYPHIKLTRELFPRILATRIIANDDSEYFGAFLNRTNARILLDFLNRTFRLRSCDLELDGSFNYPCTMFYKRRCMAPCVSALVGTEDYEEMVGLVRLFLLNDRSLFRSALNSKVADASEKLDFESAVRWRDILKAAEVYWSDSRRSVWLDPITDTITFRVVGSSIDVILISQKGRRVLGERIFAFENAHEADAEAAISEVIQQFYVFHAPKEIKVSVELSDKKDLEKRLHERFGRRVRIIPLSEKNRKVSTDLAVNRSSAELDVKRSILQLSTGELLQSLKQEFELTKEPKRITAIDVSHLSGTDQVAAAVSWVDGRIDPEGSQYWLSDATSELGSIQGFVERFVAAQDKIEAELLLIDGGTAQLRAALAADLPRNISIISAVKPAAEHESISHFLTRSGRRIGFDIANEAHRLLQRLRDEVHEYSNAVHRDTRDYANYYLMAELLPSLTEPERRRLLTAFGSITKVSMATRRELRSLLALDRVRLAADDLKRHRFGENRRVRPLVIPTSLQERDGAAEDLRPIEPQTEGIDARP